MKNILLISVIVVVILSATAYFLFGQESKENQQVVVSDYKNSTYIIEGASILLSDGVSESSVETGSSLVVTRYFGNELFKDLNDDGREDVVFLLTQETGGSGTFFYVVAALNTENGYVGSQALFLGDRIAPQTTESGPGKQIIVNYAERAIDEPMTAQPSIGKSIRLILDIDSMQFGEVVANFEGEADPDRMILGMKKWIWQKAEYNDGRKILPVKTDRFTLTFLDNGTVDVGTDCNNVGGEYVVSDSSLSFTNMRTTLMYCVDSQEAEFLKVLQDVDSFYFTSRGELVLGIKYDSGKVTFR